MPISYVQKKEKGTDYESVTLYAENGVAGYNDDDGNELMMMTVMDKMMRKRMTVC